LFNNEFEIFVVAIAYTLQMGWDHNPTIDSTLKKHYQLNNEKKSHLKMKKLFVLELLWVLL
jgi:hypothetical protein